MRSKFLDGTTLLVYLDQCVLSRFRAPTGAWVEICSLIREGARRKRFLCPYSPEHAMETAALPYAEAAKLDGIMRELSHGWSLHEPSLLAAQIFAGVTNVPLRREDILQAHLVRPLSDADVHATIQREKKRLDAFNDGITHLVNVVNDAARGGPPGDKAMFDLVVQLGTNKYGRPLLAEVERTLKTGAVTIVGRPEMPTLPTEASWVVWALLEKHKMNPNQLAQLALKLKNEGVEWVPMLRVRVRLEAHRTNTRSRIEARDQYDLTRAACALPVADLMVTDGGVATAIRETRLDADFHTEVFSTKRADQDRLLRRLRELVGS